MLLSGEVFYLALSFAIIKLLYGKRWTISTSLLTGLKIYLLEETQAPIKANNRRKRREIQFGGANRVIQVELLKDTIEKAAFYGYFDALVCLFCLTVTHGVAFFLAPFLFRATNFVFVPVTLITILASWYFLIKMDLFSFYASKFEKWYSLGIFGLCFLLTFCLFTFVPKNILAFDVAKCSVSLSQQVSNFLSRIAAQSNLACPEKVEITERVIVLGMAVAAGVMGSVLCQPAIRTTRSIQSLLHPPERLEMYFVVPFWCVVVKHFQDVILVVNCGLWLTPLIEPFQVKGHLAGKLQVTALLLWALCQLLLLRPIVQGYLNGALESWYISIQKKSQLSDHERTILFLIVQKYSLFLCKVSLQIFVPAVCVICCGFLILVGQYTENVLLEHLFGFLGWWTNLAWLICSITVIIIHRHA